MSQQGDEVGAADVVDQQVRQNDKAVMVGSTGIAQLKAEYGSGGGRFEIIQDVGYSSESSTHLSGEDNHEFIQVYSYSPATKGRTIITEYKVCRDGRRNSPPPPFDPAMDWRLTSEEEEDDDLFLDNLQPAPLSSSPRSDSPIDAQLDVSNSTTLVDRTLSDDLGPFSVRELVSQAEQLVREETRKRGLGVGSERVLKSDRVQEWLQGCSGKIQEYATLMREEPSCIETVRAGSPPKDKDTARAVESSCDASGEYTTNESSENSGSESDARGGARARRRLSHSGTGSVETVVPLVSNGGGGGVQGGSSPGRVVLRSKKRSKRDRPWSVTELYQSSQQLLQLGLSPLSTSEGALNVIGSSRLVSASDRERSSTMTSTGASSRQGGSSSPLRRHHRRHRSRASLPLQVHPGVQPSQSSGSEGASRRGHSEGSGSRHFHRQHQGRSSAHNTSVSSDSAQCSSSSCRSRQCSLSVQSVPQGKTKKRKPTSSDEFTKAQGGLSCKNSADVSSTCGEAFSSHLEDQSSVSDQAWDSYEDPPYLSEPYSEQTADAEQIKRLIEFGDDYRAFMCSDGSSSVSGHTTNRSMMRGRSQTLISNTQGSPGVESETDSDVEELQCLLQDSSHALQFARNTLRSQKKTETGMLAHSECVELLATCQTHLKCLQVISDHLDPSYHLLSSNSHEDILQDLLSGWGMLQAEVLASQENGEQFQEVQQELKDLSKKMDSLAQLLERTDNMYTSMDEIQKRIAMLQNSLSLLHETKSWLLAVNLRVHRCLTEYGLTYSTMKDTVTQLYASWDDIYEQNGSQLTELQEAYNKWQQFNEDRQKLESILAQEELEQISLSKVDYWQVAERTSKLSLAEEVLIGLHQNAQVLQPLLREDSQAWTSIKDQLEVLKDRLHKIKEEHPQRVQELLRIPEPREPSTSTSIRARSSEAKTSSESKAEVVVSGQSEERRKRSRFWRALRAALPLQVAMVLLYCLAWLMEPQCCDFLNSMHFTFSPTLRYLKGPPPI